MEPPTGPSRNGRLPSPSAPAKPTLQRPPGYRDPSSSLPPGPPRPPPRKVPQLPPGFRNPGKPPARRRRRDRSGCCRRACCWLFLIALCLAFLLAIAGALSYLWFQPRLPSFRLASVQPSNFTVTARSDGSGDSLSAVVVSKIVFANPNGKIGLSYGEGEARVAVADDDGDVPLGTAQVGGFEQGRKNSTTVRVAVKAVGVAVVDEAVGARLRRRLRSREIKFRVEVRSRVGFRVAGKMTGSVPIRLECGAVSLKQVQSGATFHECRINLFRWINLH